MLPQSLWVLVLSLVSSVESHSFAQPRAVPVNNSSLLALSASTSSILLPSVQRSTQAGTSETFSNTISSTATQLSTTLKESLVSQSETSIPLKSSSSSTQSSKTTSPRKNGTTTTAAPCCFVVQDTVSEEWWQQTSYISATSLVNLTSYTTYITKIPDSTRVETNIYPTNASFVWSFLVGKNPITNLLNQAPTPTQVAEVLNATQVVTGGTTVQSPSAFYVYSTVKIITAQPVTDDRGHVHCATASTGAAGYVFPSINGNAEAYYGGPDIAGQSLTQVGESIWTETYTGVNYYNTSSSFTLTFTNTDGIFSTLYTNSAGDVVQQTATPTGVVISLTTPFIYAPPRGTEEPRFGSQCSQDANTEDYGYIPQTLINFLAQDPFYTSQYPGLKSCYGGGPSIIQEDFCVVPIETTGYQTAGGDLTSSTTIYVGTPDVRQDSTTTTSPNQQTTTPKNGGPSILGVPTTDSPPLTAPPAGPTSSLYTVPPPVITLSGNPGQEIKSSESVTIQASTTIPLSLAPAGAVGVSSNSDGTPVLIVSPTTIPPQQPAIIIPSTTTIPLSQAPAGAVGQTTTINGTPLLIVQPTTISPAQAATTNSPFSTTLISGTPFLVIPATTIPLSLAPSNLQNQGLTTTISGTPFLIISSPTTIPIPQAQSGSQTLTYISGTPYLLLPSPLSNLPGSSPFSTTTISGTPFLLVPEAQSQTQAGGSGSGRVSEVIITGPTTIPVNPSFSVIGGQTTVISGSTFVEFTGTGTSTVLEISAGSSTAADGGSATTSSTSPGTGTGTGTATGTGKSQSQSTKTSKAAAAPTAAPGWDSSFLGILGVMGVGIVMGV